MPIIDTENFCELATLKAIHIQAETIELAGSVRQLTEPDRIRRLESKSAISVYNR